ncbi:hypothetical protein CYY_002085 [Polysphondylium violaceum]|uniref:Ankyrin repeat-containing protein n=1 Tax=Polysphondylium violaceum TaxID=133409 RepID=A0A8J4Q253_9MYCE|nr:hypothetical protein CYY_002085 [Polysphondylium violaceum]
MEKNWDAVDYMVNVCNYKIQGPQFLVYAVKDSNLEMCKRYLENGYQVSLHTTYIDVLNTKNRELINLLFSNTMQEFQKMCTTKMVQEGVLQEACQTLDVEVFKMVKESIEKMHWLFILKKSNFYSKSMIWNYYQISVQSYQMFLFVLENFDLSFTVDEDPPKESNVLIHPVLTAAISGSQQVVEYILKNKKVKQIHIEGMASLALKHGHFKLYELIRHQCGLELLPAPTDFHYFNMKNPPNTIEGLEYLLNTYQIKIVREDLERSILVSVDVFKYLLDFVITNEIPLDSIFIHNSIYHCLTTSRIEPIVYLSEKGFNLDCVWPKLFFLKPITFKFIKTLFSLILPNAEALFYLNKALIEFIPQTDDNRVFTSIIDEMVKLKRESSYYDHLFLGIARNGRVQTMKYLVNNKKIIPTNVRAILTESIQYGTLSITKFVIENKLINQNQLQENQIVILESSIFFGRLHILEYILPFYSKISRLAHATISSFQRNENLLITKFLINCPQFQEYFPS